MAPETQRHQLARKAGGHWFADRPPKGGSGSWEISSEFKFSQSSERTRRGIRLDSGQTSDSTVARLREHVLDLSR